MKTKGTQFFCVKCGHRGIPLQRQAGKMREAGHLKKLYCLFCGEETNHAELREDSPYTHREFLCEKNWGNFDAEGNRINPNWKQFVNEVSKKVEEAMIHDYLDNK